MAFPLQLLLEKRRSKCQLCEIEISTVAQSPIVLFDPFCFLSDVLLVVLVKIRRMANLVMTAMIIELKSAKESSQLVRNIYGIIGAIY